jgi:hypothetical protein
MLIELYRFKYKSINVNSKCKYYLSICLIIECDDYHYGKNCLHECSCLNGFCDKIKGKLCAIDILTDNIRFSSQNDKLILSINISVIFFRCTSRGSQLSTYHLFKLLMLNENLSFHKYLNS